MAEKRDFENWFVDTYRIMFQEIALGMVDYRESEEALLKLWDYELFEPLSFSRMANETTISKNRNIRKILSESNPIEIAIQYHLGTIDEMIAIQRAKDYGAYSVYDENNYPASLFELGLVKSSYPKEFREFSGEISQIYHKNGFTFHEIAVLTTVVPPDNPVRGRVEISHFLRE
jgi:hypothetical protein